MPPAIIAAGIGAAGAIGGGLLASSGTKSAAKTQAAADQQAIAEQQREYNTTQSEFAPYRQLGTNALGPLGDLIGTNGNDAQQAAINTQKNSPLYESLYRNGLEANLQNASATGGIRGGNEVGSLANFGSDTLAQVIQSQIGNLGGLASLGVGATNNAANFGQQTANNISSLTQNQGAAIAGGQAANAGIWSSVIGKVAGQAAGLAGNGGLFSSSFGSGSLGGAGGLNFSNSVGGMNGWHF